MGAITLSDVLLDIDSMILKSELFGKSESFKRKFQKLRTKLGKTILRESGLTRSEIVTISPDKIVLSNKGAANYLALMKWWKNKI